MLKKRPEVLMVLLLLAIGAYATESYWNPPVSSRSHVAPQLSGDNKISTVEVRQEPDGRWIAALDYFYNGRPVGALVWVDVVGVDGKTPLQNGHFKMAEAGAKHVEIEIARPIGNNPFTTSQVVAMLGPRKQPEVRAQVAQTIRWPNEQIWAHDRWLASKSREESLQLAVADIDRGDSASLDEARHLLEPLVAKDPRFAPGFVELARVAMKSNWSPEGLHQAENLLSSALKIQPDSVDAKILMGYVYAHQGRYPLAETMFVDASHRETTNLWLWSNWGELLAMQGKTDLALQKYREALTRPRTHDTYDRARLDAYQQALRLLDQRGRLDDMEALYEQRVEEFGTENCYGSNYARFILQRRGDAARGMALARQSLDPNCAASREVLGMAYYVAWAEAKDASRDEALNQARVFLPASPRAIYLLATSERTTNAAKQLIASGESIDQRDNANLNALAQALLGSDVATARRLMRLGARTDTLVGAGNLPVALLPIIRSDIDSVRLMQQSGVDYSKLRYQGATAVDFARQAGDRRVLGLLDRGSSSL